MKIIDCSDLHIDITSNNFKITEYLKNHLQKINPDVFIIAGDLANSLKDINSFLEQFKHFKMTKIYVLGNYDLWIESKNQLRKGKDSTEKEK